MLWCDKYAFVHYPKTAGKTLSRFFLQAWQGRDIHGLVSPGQVHELADVGLESTQVKVGRGHENLAETARLIRESGGELQALEAVFCCIRNPYDLMVSNYHFMRQTYANNRERPNFIIAHENDFTTYCEKVGVASPANWMTIDGAQPANLEIVRFEHLEADLTRFAERFGFERPELGHLNASTRAHYTEYLSARSEKAIAERFKYWFDNDYYTREEFPEQPIRSLAA